MKPKTIITILLIAFVAVSAVWLITSELNKPTPVKVTDRAEDDPAENVAQNSTSSQTGTTEPGSTPAPELSADANKTGTEVGEKPEPEIETPKEEKSKVVVTFFQTSHKCASCIIIENFTNTTLDKYFKQQIAAGTVQYQTINVDEPGNEHYVDDYQLVSKTLVVSLYKGKKEVKWKNLMEIWNLLNNEDGFVQLVKDTIDSYLKSGGLS